MMSTSNQEIRASNRGPEALAELDSPQMKLVYLALHRVETATATELQRLLGLSKLTLLPLLSSLVQQDLAVRTEDGYATR